MWSPLPFIHSSYIDLHPFIEKGCRCNFRLNIIKLSYFSLFSCNLVKEDWSDIANVWYKQLLYVYIARTFSTHQWAKEMVLIWWSNIKIKIECWLSLTYGPILFEVMSSCNEFHRKWYITCINISPTCQWQHLAHHILWYTKVAKCCFSPNIGENSRKPFQSFPHENTFVLWHWKIIATCLIYVWLCHCLVGNKCSAL